MSFWMENYSSGSVFSRLVQWPPSSLLQENQLLSTRMAAAPVTGAGGREQELAFTGGQAIPCK